MAIRDPSNWWYACMFFSAIAAAKIRSASAFCSSHGPSSLSLGVGSHGVRSYIAPTGHNLFCPSRVTSASEEQRRGSWTSSSSSSLKYRVAIDNEEDYGYGVGSEEGIDSLWREALRPTRESREGSIPSAPAEEISAILADGVSKELALLELQSSSLGPPTTTSAEHHDVPPASDFAETAWAFIPVALEFGAVAAAVATNAWN